MEVFAVRIADNDTTKLEALSDRTDLPAHPRARMETLAGEALARYALDRVFGCGPVRFARTPAGKPFVPDRPEWQFSVSHSGEWVVCAVADEPVGVDVERIGAVRESVARRFFTQTERAEIAASPDHDEAFTRVWVRREAMLKASGTGWSGEADPSDFLFACKRIDDYLICAASYARQNALAP